MSTRLLPRVVAHTHPPRYRLHKYWSRKPYNVVQAFVAALVPSPGVVVDPFIGSGVVAREAAQLGHTVYASDINPVSLLLTETTCSPPEPAGFSSALGALLDRLKPRQPTCGPAPSPARPCHVGMKWSHGVRRAGASSRPAPWWARVVPESAEIVGIRCA